MHPTSIRTTNYSRLSFFVQTRPRADFSSSELRDKRSLEYKKKLVKRVKAKYDNLFTEQNMLRVGMVCTSGSRGMGKTNKWILFTEYNSLHSMLLALATGNKKALFKVINERINLRGNNVIYG